MAELLFERIFDNLYLRKLYHFLGGTLMVFALLLLERNWFIFCAVLYFVSFVFIGKRVSFAILGTLILYVFSGSKNLTVYTTIIWLIGDGTAGFVGGALGKRKLPWHDRKTILGSISSFLSSWIVLLTLFILTIEAPHKLLLILSTISCLVACLFESLPVTFVRDRKQDDNLIILLFAGLTMWSFSKLLGLEILLR